MASILDDKINEQFVKFEQENHLSFSNTMKTDENQEQQTEESKRNF